MNTTNENSLQNQTREIAHEVGHILQAVKVSPRFAPHIFNMDTQENGLDNTIIAFLKSQKAIAQKGAENTHRHSTIAIAVTTDEIISHIRQVYADGQGRYKAQAVKNSLSTYLPKKGLICKFSVKPSEHGGKGKQTRYYLPA